MNTEKMSVHLLIVDDEKEIREALSRHYRFAGYNVSVASNGQEALQIMGERKTDIVISDIQMPVMGGAELCAQIRREYPLTRVIMMTGYVSLDNALTCLRRGADNCIFKPITDMKVMDLAVSQSVSTIQRWIKILEELKGLKPAGALR